MDTVQCLRAGSNNRESTQQNLTGHMEQVIKELTASDPSDQVVAERAVRVMLIENHARFLAFVRRRVEAKEAAEDILQAAYLKALQRGSSVRSGHALVWFYRELRNAVIDHYRRSAVADRTVQVEEAAQTMVVNAPDSPNVCPYASKELTRLRTEYGSALTEVDMGAAKVGEYALQVGISSNNASVRLHRARKALRNRLETICGSCAGTGCFDCNCA